MKKTKMMVGPTEIPDKVLYAMLQESISHRSLEYSVLQKKVTTNFKKIIKTNNDVLILTSSGTGAMEAVIQNCFSPQDKVVVPIIGKFSEQFAHMAELYGLEVDRVHFNPGEAAKPEIVIERVDDKTKGVFVVHNESSTGVVNNLEKFGDALKDKDVLYVVDSVSGIGGIDVSMDEWGIDVIFTSSQKALMSPAGLAFISLSDKAWSFVQNSKFPKYYFDLTLAIEYNQLNQTLTTPAIYTLYAVNKALEMILSEGINFVLERHIRNTKMLRDGIKKLNLELFVKDDQQASPTLTAIRVPGKSKEFVNKLSQKGIIVSGGIKPYDEDIFRVGTMGFVHESDVKSFLVELESIVKDS